MEQRNKQKKDSKNGPPKNTRFVFYTNNIEEPKGNTLDCNVYFSLFGHNEAKPITKSNLDFNVPIWHFRFLHSLIKEKIKTFFEN